MMLPRRPPAIIARAAYFVVGMPAVEAQQRLVHPARSISSTERHGTVPAMLNTTSRCPYRSIAFAVTSAPRLMSLTTTLAPSRPEMRDRAADVDACAMDGGDLAEEPAHSFPPTRQGMLPPLLNVYRHSFQIMERPGKSDAGIALLRRLVWREMEALRTGRPTKEWRRLDHAAELPRQGEPQPAVEPMTGCQVAVKKAPSKRDRPGCGHDPAGPARRTRG
jgi:hypothetical protein